MACRQAEVDRAAASPRPPSPSPPARPLAPPQYTQVFGEAIVRECERDPRVVGITAAMNSGTGLSILQKALPERYFDVGIAEQQAVLFAAGLALQGMRPVAAIYSTFLQRAFDQIVHDVCLQKLPVTFCMDRAGLVGDDGPTHHGVFDIAYLRPLPHMTLMAPRDEAMLVHMLHTALQHDSGPVAIRYPRGEAVGVEIPGLAVADRDRHGRGAARGRAGGDGRLRHRRRQGAGGRGPAGRERDGRDRRRRALRQAVGRGAARAAGRRRTTCSSPSRRACSPGGFGSGVWRRCPRPGRSPRMLRIGLPDRYVTHGAPKLLHQEVGFTGEAIAERIEAAVLDPRGSLAGA